jgi:hypothetical protein
MRRLDFQQWTKITTLAIGMMRSETAQMVPNVKTGG